MQTQYSQVIARDSIFGEAQKIEILNEGELVYLGYCAQDCKGTADERWLIKRQTIKDGVQTVEYSNGYKNRQNVAWDNRANITYKLTPTA